MGCKGKQSFHSRPLMQKKVSSRRASAEGSDTDYVRRSTNIKEGKKRESSCLHIPKSQWDLPVALTDGYW